MDLRWTTMIRIDTMGRKRAGQCCVIGSRFGTCEVLESTSGTRSVGKTTLKCDCGTIFTVTTRQVRRGQASRCAECAHRQRGERDIQRKGHNVISDLKLRSLWLHRRTGMISRCYNPEHEAYACYGGRGIAVYQPWIDNSGEFLKYVVTLPGWDNPDTDVDRENNDGNYEPGNIRVVPRMVNANNRRKTRFLDYQGQKYPFAEFRRIFTPTWYINALQYHIDRGRTTDWIVKRYQATRQGNARKD